jgi:cobalt-zinc-cadmium resistance protein CzcA
MKKIIISALICVICGKVVAQTPITLKAAIDTALKNNLQVKNEQLKAQYQQMLIKTSATLPQTNLMAETGQINSIYNDTKFSIGQSFSFPTVYAKQKMLLQEEWKTSLLHVAVTEANLKKQIAQVFYNLLYLNQKKALLQYADSLFGAFYKRAELRLVKGEANVLEKASAETQLGQVKMQLEQLEQDAAILQLQFQLLLNTQNAFVPNANSYKNEITALADSSSLKQHPLVKLIEQQQQIADANLAVEKSKLLPDVSVAYNNTSIRGTGADNVLYGASQRFSSVQVGVGIPIFTKAQKEKINSAKFSKQVAQSTYINGLQSLQSEYQQAINQYNKYLQTVHYFENTALKNATLITVTANQQLANGNINYLEWVQLINQATVVKSDYVEAVKNLNEAINQLNYFINQ